jgi:soluble lytic murein transglycosylase
MRIVPILVVLATACGCGSGCGRDGAPPLPAAAVPGSGDEARAEGESAVPAAPGRDLWFRAGPGRDAILARERGDHDTAVAKLDLVLADASASASDRAGALLLRGLEDLRADRFADAAARFAEAAKLEVMAPLRTRLSVLEAQARLDAGEPEVARERLAALDPKVLAASPVAGDAIVIEGDARLRTNDTPGAIASYRAYLELEGGARRLEVRTKLARALAQSEDTAALAEAVTHYEAIQLAAPLSDFSAEASRELPGLRRRGAVERPAGEQREYERRLRLAEAGAMLDRRQYAKAVREADALLAMKGLPPADACEALYVKGSAIFKQRDRAKARPVFEKADRTCSKAGKEREDLRVKSRYQAGRGLYAEGKYSAAARAFEAIAKDHLGHSYEDDAWILAGESWQEQGDGGAARKAYEAALKVGGDMDKEAQRRLLVMLLSSGDHEGALALTDAALAGPTPDPKHAAKLHYFRGKALAALKREDDAHAAWRQALALAPLDYPGLMALVRLREAGPEVFGAALEALAQRETEGGAIVIPKTPGAERAVMLARLGLGEMARDELGDADVDGWPAVIVLNQAGLFSEAQRTLGRLGTRWRSAPPTASTRPRWEAAHPKPFGDIVAPGEKDHGVPRLLTFAIMQTESRFDPSVTSWAGARGLVQLMPSTAAGLAKEAGVDLEPERLYEPAFNLELGMRYLGKLAARFGGDDGAVPLAIASYNAGAGSVDRWLSERGGWDLDLFIESIPYDETRNYTQSVLGRWHAYRWMYGEGEPADRVPALPSTTPARGG